MSDKIPKGLYGIVFPISTENFVDSAKMMIDKGAGIIQYRDKLIDDSSFLHNAEKIKQVCEDSNALFIVNDRARIAEELDTNVHLGSKDNSPILLRRSGFNNIIGYTIDNYDSFNNSIKEGILSLSDYLGTGPVFFTTMKPDKKPIGLEEVGKIIRESLLPAYVIGGIKEKNIENILSLEPAGVAIMSYNFCNNNIINKINKHYRR
ncbi:MAG: thiamine phosphate synthase [Nanoarchaeota archaeon]